MLSYPDRSVFRAKLAEKGDPQMMDPKYKDVSADFLRRANEDYGLQRVAIGDPVGNGAEAINLARFAKEHMLAYLAVIDPDETIPRDTDRARARRAGRCGQVRRTDTSPSLLCFLSCSIMFIMPFMSFMNFMWPKPEPGAVMCGWNDMSEGRILKFGDDAPTDGRRRANGSMITWPGRSSQKAA